MLERSFTDEGIPLLTVAADASPRPAVLFYHGLQSDKETHRKELHDLAARGFLAVGVDAVGHGVRRMDDLSGFLNRGPLREQVAQLLEPATAEVPRLVDYLIAEGCAPVGIAGISFGGMLAFGAVQREPRLRAAVAILGDPRWCEPDPARFAGTALFAWNASRDQHVDPAPAREFLAELQRTHPAGHYAYREFPRSDHFMEPEEWNAGWAATLDWFSAHLRAS